MKMNVDDKLRVPGEFVAMETLIEKGRQLHSKAFFDICAKIFKRKSRPQANFNINEQHQELVDSH